MSTKTKIKKRTQRRARVVRNNLPRVSVFRSLDHIYAQIIDDAQQKTLVSASSLTLKDVKGSKSEIAHAIGIALAKLALEKGVKKAAFDRGSYLYHGRVKALAEGVRAGGLEI